MEERPDWTEGKPFWRWYWQETKIASKIIPLMAIGFVIALLLSDTDGFDHPAWKWGAIAFFGLQQGIFWFKTWQHWNDLRHGRSR